MKSQDAQLVLCGEEPLPWSIPKIEHMTWVPVCPAHLDRTSHSRTWRVRNAVSSQGKRFSNTSTNR